MNVNTCNEIFGFEYIVKGKKKWAEQLQRKYLTRTE